MLLSVTSKTDSIRGLMYILLVGVKELVKLFSSKVRMDFTMSMEEKQIDYLPGSGCEREVQGFYWYAMLCCIKLINIKVID